MKRAFAITGTIVALAIGAVLFMGAGTVEPKAEVPQGAQEAASKVIACQNPMIPDLYFQVYEVDGEATLYTIGTIEVPDKRREPRVFVYFTGQDEEKWTVFLLANGKPVEKMTLGELAERYPSPCDLLPVIFTAKTSI